MEQAPSFGALAAELACGIVLYDLLFFPLHLAMHRAPIPWLRALHGYHHRQKHTLNALETVQHSFADGALQVVVNVLVQQVTPFGPLGAKHPLSRLLHNVLVTYLLCESHSGYADLPFMMHRLWPGLFGGAPRHEGHHHDGRVSYQQVRAGRRPSHLRRGPASPDLGAARPPHRPCLLRRAVLHLPGRRLGLCAKGAPGLRLGAIGATTAGRGATATALAVGPLRGARRGDAARVSLVGARGVGIRLSRRRSAADSWRH